MSGGSVLYALSRRERDAVKNLHFDGSFYSHMCMMQMISGKPRVMQDGALEKERASQMIPLILYA